MTFEAPSGTFTLHVPPEDGQPAPALLTPAEAAHFLNLRRSTLDDYARRGIVPSVRLGRHRRFRRSDLERFLQDL